ncbi:MAG TPA: hypothetical protein VNH83_00765 [Bryobacteraceae bacterium]|nr:hypothetical protein [Bryobacteraceae bacterium]
MSSTTIRFAILALGVYALAGQQPSATAAGGTETVISTFRVRAGKEAEFAKVHARAWPAYRRFGLVAETPHLVLQGVDEAGKPYFVELLTWTDHEAPDHASAEVRAIWAQLEALCEPRLGHRGIEFPEVRIVRAEK